MSRFARSRLRAGVLGAAVLVLSGACAVAPRPGDRPHYPDAQGWNRTALEGDAFRAFFPLRLTGGLYLNSPNEQGVFDSERPATPGAAFVESRDGRGIAIGSTPAGRVTVLTARRAFYTHAALTEMPVFKMWVEQVSAADFPRYRESVQRFLRRFEAASAPNDEAIEVTVSSYRAHEYALYLRRNLSFEGLSKKNSIGGVYVFFPEKNTVLFLFFFNTRYHSASAYMLSKSDVQGIVAQFIDSAGGCRGRSARSSRGLPGIHSGTHTFLLACALPVMAA